MRSQLTVSRTCGLWLALVVAPLGAWAELTFTSQEAEFGLTRGMSGDQVYPQVRYHGTSGYVVWQDNATDGDGSGISARLLNNYLSPVAQRTFRVNQLGAGDQEKPQLALLPDGGAVFVWQGGPQGSQDVFARFLRPDGTFATGDALVNGHTADQQVDPVVAVLADGTVLVAWSSLGQDGSLQGIYAQRLSAAGVKLGGEFAVNQFTSYNQRSPAVAALRNGNVVVAWVSEQQRYSNGADVFARLYSPTGAALGNEFLVNTTTNLCANPALAAEPDGAFLVAWSERDLVQLTNGWDIRLRRFDATGQPLGAPSLANQRLKGDQYAPRIASVGGAHLVVWTSLGQDTSREGIFGRFIESGAFAGDEFRANTTTISQQMHPAVATDGEKRFLVVWTSFIGSPSNFDLFAQRYSADQALSQPAAPFVAALDQYQLAVSWPDLTGYPVAGYRLYVDGSATAIRVTQNYHVLSDLSPASTHTVSVAYELADGRVSPASEPATGKTWGRDANYDGLPDDWEVQFWTATSAAWPRPDADSDGDGASNLQEWLAGTDPTDASSVLRTELIETAQGTRLTWNTQPGLVYQVQVTTDLGSWSDLGGPRFAAGAADSVAVTGPSSVAYFRILRVR
jgi:hypothetical protein